MPFFNKSGFSTRMKKIIGRAEDQEYQLTQDIVFCKNEVEVVKLKIDLDAIVKIKQDLAEAARAEAEGNLTPEQQAVLDNVDLAHKIQDMKKDHVEMFGPRPVPLALHTIGSLFQVSPSWEFPKAATLSNESAQSGPRGESVEET